MTPESGAGEPGGVCAASEQSFRQDAGVVGRALLHFFGCAVPLLLLLLFFILVVTFLEWQGMAIVAAAVLETTLFVCGAAGSPRGPRLAALASGALSLGSLCAGALAALLSWAAWHEPEGEMLAWFAVPFAGVALTHAFASWSLFDRARRSGRVAAFFLWLAGGSALAASVIVLVRVLPASSWAD
jgi:hypothetical protein